MPGNELADQVCLAAGFSPQGDKIDLNVRERQISVNTTGAALSEKDNTYYYAAFSNETIYSCEMYGAVSNNENVDLCADLRPKEAKLNFYLVVMNGVRVVFTKTLAFNTILTIRAMLG